MKKSIYILLLSIASLSFLLAGCGKASHNHRLSGNWQIKSIENRVSNTTSYPEDLYIDMNLHVVNLHYSQPNSMGINGPSGNMAFDHDEMRLSMDFPYVNADEMDKLQRFGIFANPVVFTVEKLDSKQLVLQSPESVITCRRF